MAHPTPSLAKQDAIDRRRGYPLRPRKSFQRVPAFEPPQATTPQAIEVIANWINTDPTTAPEFSDAEDDEDDAADDAPDAVDDQPAPVPEQRPETTGPQEE